MAAVLRPFSFASFVKQCLANPALSPCVQDWSKLHVILNQAWSGTSMCSCPLSGIHTENSQLLQLQPQSAYLCKSPAKQSRSQFSLHSISCGGERWFYFSEASKSAFLFQMILHFTHFMPTHIVIVLWFQLWDFRSIACFCKRVEMGGKKEKEKKIMLHKEKF